MSANDTEEFQHLRANISETPRREDYMGSVHTVVPVVMAIAEVEMNSARISLNELESSLPAWNGEPVTVGHPVNASGDYISASSSPRTLAEWCVGRLFNAELTEDGRLRAEAWISHDLADDELIEVLEDGESNVDVSTGYFSGIESGYYVNVKPDHLALLPDEPGACSWRDGCGVRANKQTKKGRGAMARVNEALRTIKSALNANFAEDELDTNRRGDEDDYYQMKADLISDDRSPFTSEDEMAMDMLSKDTMKTLRDDYLTNCDDSMYNQQESGENPSTQEGESMSESAEHENSEANEQEMHLNAEDREALEIARNIRAEHREKLIAEIQANSQFSEETLSGYDTQTLEAMHSVASSKVDYSGQPVAGLSANESAQSLQEVAEAMQVQGTRAVLQNRNK